MSKPDYVKCVAKYLDRDITWCGRTISEWVFTDAEHAIKNAYKKGRLLICEECSEELIFWTGHGTWDDGSTEKALEELMEANEKR